MLLNYNRVVKNSVDFTEAGVYQDYVCVVGSAVDSKNLFDVAKMTLESCYS